MTFLEKTAHFSPLSITASGPRLVRGFAFLGLEDRRMKEDATNGWRWRKEISIGDLLVAGGLIVSAMVWGAKLDTRIAILEDRVSQQALTDQRQDVAWREAAARIEQRVLAMDSKLDKLIELQIGSRTVTGL